MLVQRPSLAPGSGALRGSYVILKPSAVGQGQGVGDGVHIHPASLGLRWESARSSCVRARCLLPPPLTAGMYIVRRWVGIAFLGGQAANFDLGSYNFLFLMKKTPVV